MLRLSNITKDYKIAAGTVHALKGVSLSFRKNEFVCILGQSGCGKTTLLNIIGGLDHYTTGDLVIQGKSTKDFKDRDWDVYRNHRIGFIFQTYNLIPHQTVLGNVELALTIAGLPREERRARAVQALERVGLGDELTKRPNQLSGGQMQRVAIARALVNNPDILLADEPTGALDSKTSVQIMDLIRQIAGERLVIMVTHNPELAEQYATRIVRLSDGTVADDSNPYSEEEEAKETHFTPETSQKAEEGEPAPQEGSAQPAKKKGKKEKKARARMGFLTSLALSGRNLLTKKGRTILTSVAGSIGIISVCLVLALSSGFNAYIKRTEEDMLSYYPVEINESAFDLSSAMMSFTSPSQIPSAEELEDKVYIDSFLTSLANGISVTNDISDNYLSYIDGMDKSWYSAIQFSYGATLTNNLFTNVVTGVPETSQGTGREITTEYLSLSQLKAQYITDLYDYAPQYSSLVPFSSFFGNIITRMPGTSDFQNAEYGVYVNSQYDVVKGSFPKNVNEAVLVVGANNAVSDLTLAQLGLLEEPDFLKLFELGEENTVTDDIAPESVLAFDDIIGKEYVFYSNDEVYTENAGYNAMSPLKGEYKFSYSGKRESLATTDGKGISVKITGILRLKEGLTYGCLTSGLNITEATVNDYIAMNMQSKIVEWMQGDEGKMQGFTISPAENLNSHYQDYAYEFESPKLNESGMPVINPETMRPEMEKKTVTLHVHLTHDGAIRAVGGSNKVSSVAIYATDFDGKEHILSYLDEWNDWCSEGASYNGAELGEGTKITYTDRVGLLMGMVQDILDAITVVLVAFTAISLVVSSVMIGIITYVSVVERVKEIGVLRSLGARKQDIRNLFNAETFIIGLTAGVIGVAVTYLLELPINAIIKYFAGIGGMASLPFTTALIMVAISVVLTLISGLIPASKAAKKDPVIALRTE